MTAIRVAGTLLSASTDDRTLTYRLLPFGEPGRTSLGTVTVSPGVVELPADVTAMSANLEHDRTRPVAKFVSVTESDDGLDAVVRVLATSAGNDLLVEAAEGVRTGISVEIDAPVIKAGALQAGVLDGAGFVTNPAFPSAQLVAADTEDPNTADADQAEDEAAAAAEEEGTVPENTAVDETAPDNLTASAPRSLGDVLRTKAAGVGVPRTVEDVARRLTARAFEVGPEQAQRELVQEMAATRLTAATGDILLTDSEAAIQPTWLGEVWAQRTHRPKFASLFTGRPLTGPKAVGFVVTDAERGTVDDYAGEMAAIPTGDFSTTSVEIDAVRYAGGNKVDRINVDFPNAEFWTAYYREQANNVSRKLDAAAIAHMVTAANYTALTASAVTGTTVVDKVIGGIVDGILAIEERSVPDFAIVPLTAYKELLMLRQQDILGYLAVSLGLDPTDGRIEQFKIVPTTNTAIETATGDKKVLVGATGAHEKFGERELRVESVNVGDGSVSTGLFGYYALHTGDAKSFQLVTIDTAA
ncbi:hypothetical protein [Promicromonospora sp. NPDC050880]|uniref:hypothetical protein n=1 Tax=Promicromonospora sp. NPDC050880 TaxID=3364406 RepID=UPI0037A4CA40